jgi:hypothetical protein
MRSGCFLRLIALLPALLAAPAAYATTCLPHAPSVSEEDMTHPPAGAVAFRAEILKIVPHGQMATKPHLGFAIDYKVIDVYQGALPQRLISVEYGSCQDLPGSVGDTVPVLVIKDRFVDWFAPEFWQRAE